jgi:hypothetical protein
LAVLDCKDTKKFGKKWPLNKKSEIDREIFGR